MIKIMKFVSYQIIKKPKILIIFKNNKVIVKNKINNKKKINN